MATELGCHWGDYPVDFGDFEAIYALDLPGRLERLPGLGGRRGLVDRGHEGVARVLDYLLADEASHARTGARWSTYVRERTPVAGAPERRYSGILSRPRRPALPLLETAFWEVWNGLRTSGRAGRAPCRRHGCRRRGPSGLRAPARAKGAARGTRGSAAGCRKAIGGNEHARVLPNARRVHSGRRVPRARRSAPGAPPPRRRRPAATARARARPGRRAGTAARPPRRSQEFSPRS